jgi:hypothetical protein
VKGGLLIEPCKKTNGFRVGPVLITGLSPIGHRSSRPISRDGHRVGGQWASPAQLSAWLRGPSRRLREVGRQGVRFDYAYVGLPTLDGEPYATGENLPRVALSAPMRVPTDWRAASYAKGLKRIAGSGENDYRRFLLAECLEAYAEVDELQKERLQALLHAEASREIEPGHQPFAQKGTDDAADAVPRRPAFADISVWYN